MRCKSSYFTAVFLALAFAVLIFGSAKAETPTPTPWVISTWGVTPSPFPMCTFTPGPTTTSMFETPPPFVACPPCRDIGIDMCGNTCVAAPTATITPTNTPTPQPTQNSGLYFSNISYGFATFSGPYKHFDSQSGDCHLQDNNRTIHCLATALQNHHSDHLILADAYFYMGFRVLPNTNGCVYMHVFGEQGAIPGYTTFTNTASAVNCSVVSPTVTSINFTDTSFVIGRTTTTTNWGQASTYMQPSLDPHWKTISVNYYISLDWEPLTPTPPANTQTATPTQGNCGGGIATPSMGGGGDPIVWINPPEIVTGSCYTIIPQLTLPIPGLVTTIINPLLPEGWQIPGSVGTDGYQLCVDWLMINMSFMGVQYDGLIGVAAWLFVAGLVYKEIAS
jgi:hypothetical protein